MEKVTLLFAASRIYLRCHQIHSPCCADYCPVSWMFAVPIYLSVGKLDKCEYKWKSVPFVKLVISDYQITG